MEYQIYELKLGEQVRETGSRRPVSLYVLYAMQRQQRYRLALRCHNTFVVGFPAEHLRERARLSRDEIYSLYVVW